MRRPTWGVAVLLVGLLLLAAGLWSQYGWSVSAIVVGALIAGVDVLALMQGDRR